MVTPPEQVYQLDGFGKDGHRDVHNLQRIPHCHPENHSNAEREVVIHWTQSRDIFVHLSLWSALGQHGFDLFFGGGGSHRSIASVASPTPLLDLCRVNGPERSDVPN